MYGPRPTSMSVQVSSRMGGAAMDGDASIDSTDSQPTGGELAEDLL